MCSAAKLWVKVSRFGTCLWSQLLGKLRLSEGHPWVWDQPKQQPEPHLSVINWRTVLASFRLAWHKLELSERRGPQLRKCLLEIWPLDIFLLVIDGEGPSPSWWCHPWAGGPRFSKKSGCVSHEEQASSMASESATASRFLPWLPSVGCDSGYVNQRNPFLHKLLLAMVFHHSDSNPN